MNNESQFEEMSSLINVLNDFTLTVLAPLPNNSQLLSLWYKFKPLLISDSSDSSKIQAFITGIETETPRSSFRKPPLSFKGLPDSNVDGGRETVPPGGINSLTSRGDSFCKADGSCEIVKKSGNSTRTSNSAATPNSVSVYNSCQDQIPSKSKASDISNRLELQYYQSKSDKHDYSQQAHSFEAPTFGKDAPISLHSSIHKAESNDRSNNSGSENSLDNQNIYQKSIQNPEDGKLSIKLENDLGVLGRMASDGRKSGSENRMDQRAGDNYHPEPPTPSEKFIPRDIKGDFPTRCPPALDYIAKTLHRPISFVSNYSFYNKYMVFESTQGRNTFYYSLTLNYFLYILGDTSTSLVLSNLYEKVVIRKLKLIYYANPDKLYSSLTSSLKAIIHEKIAKPGQKGVLQELFLHRYFSDIYFRDGLVAILKELLVIHISGLDNKNFDTLFGQISLEKLILNIRSSDEPTEEIISGLPYIVEGNIEVHYIRPQKIEIVLYNQKTVRNFKQPLFSVLCVPNQQYPEKNLYHGLINREHVELMEKIDIWKLMEQAEVVMKETIYMSLNSSMNLEEADDKDEGNDKKRKIIDKFSRNKSKDAATKKPKVKLNREHLLNKVENILSSMNKHSERIFVTLKPNPFINTIPKGPSNIKQTGTAPSSNPIKQNETPAIPRYASPSTLNTLTQNTFNTHNLLNKQPIVPTRDSSNKSKSPLISNPPTLSTPSIQEMFREGPRSQSPLVKYIPTYSNETSNKIMSARELFKYVHTVGNKTEATNPPPNSGKYRTQLPVTSINSKPSFFDPTTINNYSLQLQSGSLNPNKNLAGSPKTKLDRTEFFLKEIPKENRRGSITNLRSPLKNIIVYSHQRDGNLANLVDRQVSAIEEALRRSPKLTSVPDKLIFEDSII